MPTYIIHFSAQTDVSEGFYTVGFASRLVGGLITVVPDGYEAVISGAIKVVNYAEGEKQRLHTLNEVVSFLRSNGVPITAYLPTSGFVVDESGWVYWSESPGSIAEAELFKQ